MSLAQFQSLYTSSSHHLSDRENVEVALQLAQLLKEAGKDSDASSILAKVWPALAALEESNPHRIHGEQLAAQLGGRQAAMHPRATAT